MNKTLMALAASTLFALSSASVLAAAHTGSPMATPPAKVAPAAPATAPMAPTSGTDLSGTKADAKALEKKADADYKTAKDACKPMKGAEEKACKKSAKAVQEKAEARAKGIHEMAEAKTDKERAKVTAKYEKKIAAAEKKAAK